MKETELIEIIRKLQETGQEWNTVDAKRELILKEVGDKAEFVKDIIAMANNKEPSYLVIGLEDGTFTSLGTLSNHYHRNNINQILVGKIDPPLVIDYQEIMINENEYAVVEIVGRNPPYIVDSDLIHNREDRKRVRIHKGTIYIRHGDRTEGISRAELEGLFKSDLRKEFEDETDNALQLALNQPDFWEYLLTAELLNDRVAQIRRSLTDLERELVYKRTVNLNFVDFFSWMRSKCADLSSLIILLSTAVTEEIPTSWGEPGKPGDPLEIKRAVDKVASGCNELLEWESDLRSVNPPDSFIPLKQMMAGWTSQTFQQIESLPMKLLEPFEQSDPEGEYNIEIVFESPSNIDEVVAEIKRIEKHPERWMTDNF